MDEPPVTSKVIAAFARHPTAATYVASMLAGYGELEYFWSQCLGAVLRDDNAALHMLFRVRSEAARLDIADAVLAPRFAAVDLADEYANAIAAMRWCRRVRNQYAHSHWTQERGNLCIFSMEDAAKKGDDGRDPPIEIRPLKLSSSFGSGGVFSPYTSCTEIPARGLSPEDGTIVQPTRRSAESKTATENA